jgi:hypothetical protein
MKHLRGMVICLVIVIAGMLAVSIASSQIQIRVFSERRTRPHFMYYPHHRSWADGRYYQRERRRDYQDERRRDYRDERRRDFQPERGREIR